MTIVYRESGVDTCNEGSDELLQQTSVVGGDGVQAGWR